MAHVDDSFGEAGAGEPGAALPADAQYPAVVPLDVTIDTVCEGATVLRVRGEIDTLTAPIIARQIDEHFAARADDDARRFVVDLTGVTFLASAGLAVLASTAALAEKHRTQVRLVAEARVVLRPMSLTGLDKALRIVPDLAAALED